MLFSYAFTFIGREVYVYINIDYSSSVQEKPIEMETHFSFIILFFTARGCCIGSRKW